MFSTETKTIKKKDGSTYEGWIGFDLDGTLAKAPDGGLHSIGDPIQPMVDLCKGFLADGWEIRIVTARASPPFLDPNGDRVTGSVMIKEVQDWTEKHLGARLPVTCSKDYRMIRLYDDRAIQVEFNTGKIVGGSGSFE